MRFSQPVKLQMLITSRNIETIYGNVVYSRLRKELIYVFKVSPTGQVYPEVVPDMQQTENAGQEKRTAGSYKKEYPISNDQW